VKRAFDFWPAGFAILLLISCTAGPAVREEPVPAPAPEIAPAPEQVYSAMDLIAERIKQNGDDIQKYFIIDGDSNIIVKADFADPSAWNAAVSPARDYEVVYDLENAAGRFSPPGLWVDFVVTEKASGLSRRDGFIWTPRPGKSGLLLAFDDDYTEAWERYFDLFDTYGAKVTFFVIGEFSPFCDEALRRGHDIGYHSLHHLDLRKQSRSKFTEETILGAESFRESGIPLAAFAYP
jgi:hypothetical protein